MWERLNNTTLSTYLADILIECLKPWWMRMMVFRHSAYKIMCYNFKSPFINKRNSNINLFTQCHYTISPLQIDHYNHNLIDRNLNHSKSEK